MEETRGTIENLQRELAAAQAHHQMHQIQTLSESRAAGSKQLLDLELAEINNYKHRIEKLREQLRNTVMVAKKVRILFII